MATTTKAALIAKRNTDLAGSPKITAEAHRGVNESQDDNAYGDKSTENNNGGGGFDNYTNTEPVSASTRYNLDLTKQGRFVHIAGILLNKTGATAASADWLTFLNDYVPGDTEPQYLYGFVTTTQQVVEVQVTVAGKLKILTPIANNATVRLFPQIYLTKD